jgi:methionyl-tRNA formyltransferase
MSSLNPPRIAFFGTPSFVKGMLDTLTERGFPPTLIITQPDAPQGRGLVVTPSPVKEWALAHEIDVATPENLKPENIPDELLNSEWDLFIVASYGSIIPKVLLDKPKHGTINYHPSLLPKLRGASPYRSAILLDQRDAVGISIIELDEEMDHGPILAQARITLDEWPVGALLLEGLLAEQGAELLAETIPSLLDGTIVPEEQNHAEATVTKKIKKEDGLLNLSDDGYQNYLKYCALEGWPGTFFFAKRGGKEIRVKIVEAEYKDGTFTPTRVIPEGKSEMAYEDFMRGISVT